MTLENGRDIIRGVLILLFAVIAWWLDTTTGLLLLALMGLLILQCSFTNWCPADIFLRLMGLQSWTRVKCSGWVSDAADV